ncbi:beta-glucan synthesis-associated protein [Punctularia strigosozonata HHB-11173 SS5]|uniref:beta-glucan synthesis-associated protein n=1 Tax=Punctularia strigosozonata (strain HHB-11173) TaxID=741275 RepID=UPI0004418602|nr:beta-glucan synthesis-associated protein [Punctularia strigosozonata HHB-11173 SS5]EIN10535.1 beta-glucan synthesis-associated protein [Punctularia strigosozonata HHB-11173 SS5]
MAAVNAARGSDEIESPATSNDVLHHDDPAGSSLVLPTAPFARPPRTSSSSSLNVRRSHDIFARNSTDLSQEKEKLVDPFASFTHRVSSIYSDTPYGPRVSSFSLAPDPRLWGSQITPDVAEDDDQLHQPDEKEAYRKIYRDSEFMTSRGLSNLGCLILLIVIVIGLFAGLPLAVHLSGKRWQIGQGYNIGGINASGQIPAFPHSFGLIDADTPQSAYTKPSWRDGSEMELVFSDEFNVDGRTFYPGDDPYWEAVDLWYWPTNNFEWYDPSAISTSGGNMIITLSAHPEHERQYTGGMVQTWNKFCFTGGYVETNVILPGVNNIVGLWPAVWTMGNLGRAGYGATTDGLWPYSYDACDVGTAPNQTLNGEPAAALVDGDQGHGGVLSFLPGQRLSRCTCPDDADLHPGPKHSDGTFVGRAAPEIDVFEAQITGNPLVAQVSQSAQWAPFNHGYKWLNTSDNEVIINATASQQNTFIGSITQQATSVVTATDPDCYEYEKGCASIYGFEYLPGFDDAYITWISDNKVSWTLNVAGLGADPLVEISDRPVPQEPMYLIANLGMSTNFGTVDLDHLPFPVHMYIDYIRVYQPKGQRNIGCDPPDFPTATYINKYLDAYTNPNFTTWTGPQESGGFGQTFPRNSFLGQC